MEKAYRYNQIPLYMHQKGGVDVSEGGVGLSLPKEKKKRIKTWSGRDSKNPQISWFVLQSMLGIYCLQIKRGDERHAPYHWATRPMQK